MSSVDDPLSDDDVGGSLFFVVGFEEDVPDPFVEEEPDPLVLEDDELFGAVEPDPFLPFIAPAPVFEPIFLATLLSEEDEISRVGRGLHSTASQTGRREFMI